MLRNAVICLVAAGALLLGSMGGQTCYAQEQPNIPNSNAQGAMASKTKADIRPYRPNEVLVKVNESSAPMMMQSRRLPAAIKAAIPGSRLLRRLSKRSKTALIELPVTLKVKEAVDKLNRTPGIVLAEPNYIYQTFQTIPNDDQFELQWGMHNTGQTGAYGDAGTPDVDINAPEAWDYVSATTAAGELVWTGEAVYVGVIDTGVNYLHPDLAANIWTNPNESINGLDDDHNGYVDDIHGISPSTGTSEPMAVESHGSHVAGIIAGVGANDKGIAGVAWGAKLIPCRAFRGMAGNVGTSYDVIQCLDYMLDLKEAGLNIVATNNSWGGTEGSQLLEEAIARHQAADILFVAAAGNFGFDNDETPIYPASFELDNIISVANVDRTGQLDSSSCYGQNSVDIGAPGAEILSTINEDYYEFYYGTSMAAPHVTGAAALLKACDPSLTGAQIKAQLLANGKPLASLEGNTVTGKMLRAIGVPRLDADSDGMTDNWETDQGLDPNNAADAASDPDADGLTNLEEFSLRSDPNDPDSDNDGLGDGAEKNIYFSNPKLADTDGDGLSDSDELNLHGTNPLRVDTDGDQRADGIEIAAGTDPISVDSDGDGVRDNVEVRMYTDPTDPGDYPDAWPLRVGILALHHAALAPGLDLVKSELMKTGLVYEVGVVDFCTSQNCETQHTPTVAEMLAYDAIFVMPAAYDTSPETGDLLADYSDAGGAVVISGGRPLQGRWLADGYDPLVLTDSQWYSMQDPFLQQTETMTIIDPTHPIMSGVETFDGGVGSSHYRTAVTSGAEVIARWTTAYPLVAVKQVGQQRHVALNFNPYSNGTSDLSEGLAIFQFGGWKEQTDGAYIMANSLQYAAFGQIFCTGCNDHDHCTADLCDPLTGCENTAIHGYCLCEAHEATIQIHVGSMRVRYEVEQDCSACSLGCFWPSECAVNTQRYYAVGTGEDLGIDPERVVTLYTEDHRASWTQTPCVLDIGEPCIDDSDCVDEFYCDGARICDNGFCKDDGIPVVCDDDADCTTDICNEETDTCDFIPNDAACNDNDQCTIDQCNPNASDLASGCVYTDNPDCSDDCQDFETTVDQHVTDGRAELESVADCSGCRFGICGWPAGCAVITNQYTAVGSGEDLGSDGAQVVSLFSIDNGQIWSIGQCEQSICTDDASCDDAIACTDDSCDIASGHCIHTPVDANCSAGVCETAYCDANLGCVTEPVPNCCGNGSCESGEDSCTCAEDCGAPSATETGDQCTDGKDNDCDGLVDDMDPDCETVCLEAGQSCQSSDQCCDDLECRGLFRRTCR